MVSISRRGDEDLRLTRHALDQMNARGVSREAVEVAVQYGRVVWTRGARVFALGRKELERMRELSIGRERLEGLQVVTTADGAVLTVYRNRDFRGLRIDKRPRFGKMPAAPFERGISRGNPDLASPACVAA